MTEPVLNAVQGCARFAVAGKRTTLWVENCRKRLDSKLRLADLKLQPRPGEMQSAVLATPSFHRRTSSCT